MNINKRGLNRNLEIKIIKKNLFKIFIMKLKNLNQRKKCKLGLKNLWQEGMILGGNKMIKKKKKMMKIENLKKNKLYRNF